MYFKQKPSLLFTPGNKVEHFSKARTVHSSGVILDLEDSVASKDKLFARNQVINYLKDASSKDLIHIVRINHISTIEGLADILALAQSNINIDALLSPKTESAVELNLISEILSNYPNLPLIALIETAMGISVINQIVHGSKNISALMFGAADYALDIGSQGKAEDLMLARMQLVQAAAIKKLACYDSPFFNFDDDKGLVDSLIYAQNIGFTGKAAIHPKQVTVINHKFKPSDIAYFEAKKIVETFENSKGEVCQYKGKMIDIPVYKKSQTIISLYEQLT
ncbi:CoA ester lyase [Francisella noatunensis]|uniref:CoA ester lyase n=1 Tax=Francisella noatunensis TaxID=657445 RepID=A0A9Q2KQN1_9GAMM|nr:aldolase/citrate lyase family protein [Francisella noatunensis]MBK2028522.1 CoA ester lyase [Francisella noatunensis]MBK2034733.1 CoA ester lyase [Francisella noatunensis]MBK2049433.1 CoA ester lyase [Francisella noatunensis]MBK2051979.1 CoA ester lyase [Francisella noatunensis]MBK2053426.1 CoA ester lyase [Francisella noatunensis]